MKLYRIDETKTVGADDAYTNGRGSIPGGALVPVELDIEAAADAIPKWILDTLGEALARDSLVRILFAAALGEDTKWQH